MAVKANINTGTSLSAAINKPSAVKVKAVEHAATTATTLGVGTTNAVQFASVGINTSSPSGSPNAELIVNGDIEADNLTLSNELIMTNPSESVIAADLGLSITGGKTNSPGATIALKEFDHAQFPSYVFFDADHVRFRHRAGGAGSSFIQINSQCPSYSLNGPRPGMIIGRGLSSLEMLKTTETLRVKGTLKVDSPATFTDITASNTPSLPGIKLTSNTPNVRTELGINNTPSGAITELTLTTLTVSNTPNMPGIKLTSNTPQVRDELGLGTANCPTFEGLTIDSGNVAAENKTKIGQAIINGVYDNFATFTHSNVHGLNLANYALKQSSNGATHVNAKSGQTIQFKLDNSTKAKLESTGEFTFNNTPNMPGFHITSNTPQVRDELALGTSDCPTLLGLTTTNDIFARNIALGTGISTPAAPLHVGGKSQFEAAIGVGTTPSAGSDILTVNGNSNFSAGTATFANSPNIPGFHITSNTPQVRDELALGESNTASFAGVNIADALTHTGDLNTKVKFSGNDTIDLETAGYARLRVDSSGNVGIGQDFSGTGGPDDTIDAKLHVKGTVKFNNTPSLSGINLLHGSNTPALRTEIGLGNLSSFNTPSGAITLATSQISGINNTPSGVVLNSAALTSTPTAPTASSPTNTTQIATTAFVQTRVATKIAELVDTAPSTLNTLNELAEALNDSPAQVDDILVKLGEKTAKASNLSDLTNVATARTNLGINNTPSGAVTLATSQISGLNNTPSNVVLNSPTITNQLRVVKTNSGNETLPLKVQNDAVGNSSVGMAFTASTSDEFVNAKIVSRRPSGTAGGTLEFYTRQSPNGGFSVNENMRITDEGNVGIGTSAPTAKLHVAGTSLFSNTPSLPGINITSNTPNVRTELGLGVADNVTLNNLTISGGSISSEGGITSASGSIVANSFSAGGSSNEVTLGSPMTVVMRSVEKSITMNVSPSMPGFHITSNTPNVRTELGLGNVTNESKATMFTNPTFSSGATVSSGTLTVGATGGKILISETEIQAQSSDNANQIMMIGIENISDADDIVLGSTSGDRFNDNLIFRTNGSEKARFNTGKFVLNNTPDMPGLHITSNTPNVRTELGLGTANSPTFAGITIADQITHSGDTNTFIRFPTTDQISFTTAGTERVRFDETGKVGIGVTDPDEMLSVAGNIHVRGADDTTQAVLQMGQLDSSATTPLYTMSTTDDGGDELRLTSNRYNFDFPFTRGDATGSLEIGAIRGIYQTRTEIFLKDQLDISSNTMTETVRITGMPDQKSFIGANLNRPNSPVQFGINTGTDIASGVSLHVKGKSQFDCPIAGNTTFNDTPTFATPTLKFTTASGTGKGIRLKSSNNVSGVSIGADAVVSASYSVALGSYSANTAVTTTAPGQGQVSIGSGQSVHSGALRAITIGTYASNNNASSDNAISIGSYAQCANVYTTAIGFNAIAGGYGSLAIGGMANTHTSAQEAIAIGFNADANNANSVRAIAIGHDTDANGTDSMAIGTTSQALQTSAVAIGTNVTSNVAKVAEIGYWSDATTRGSAIRICGNTGAVQMALQLQSSNLSDGGGTAGSEADNTLPRSFYQFRRTNTELFIEMNSFSNMQRIKLASGISGNNFQVDLAPTNSPTFTGKTTLEKVTMSANSFMTETSSFVLNSPHEGAIIFCNNAAPMTIGIPNMSAGFNATFIAKSSALVDFSPAAGIGVNSFNGANRIAGFAGQASIIYNCPTVAFLGGNIV